MMKSPDEQYTAKQHAMLVSMATNITNLTNQHAVLPKMIEEEEENNNDDSQNQSDDDIDRVADSEQRQASSAKHTDRAKSMLDSENKQSQILTPESALPASGTS